MPSALTRGHGGVPLVEIPACRRLVEQSVTIPLFQNEPPTRDEEIPDAIGGSRQVRDVVHRQRGDNGIERTRLGEFLERDAAEQRSLRSDRIHGDDRIPGRRKRIGEITDRSAPNLQDAGGQPGQIAKHVSSQTHPVMITGKVATPADNHDTGIQGGSAPVRPPSGRMGGGGVSGRADLSDYGSDPWT